MDARREKILKEAINLFGVKHQMAMCVEEMAELMQAMSKHNRAGGTCAATLMHLREEIADARIMLDQMAIMFAGIELDTMEAIKLDRLEKTIQAHRAIIER